MKRVTALLLTLVLAFAAAGSVSAADEVEISGELKSDLVGNPNSGGLTDTETFNLMLEKKFGFDADLYLDLEFKSYTKDKAVVPTGDEKVESYNLPENKRETDVNIEEAYVNYYTKKIDWRLGKQRINWGSAYKLQPTNYFNPRDLTALKPMDVKEGVKAVKGIYYGPNRVEVSGVVTPFFKSHEMSPEGKLDSLSRMTSKTKIQTGKTIYKILDQKGLIVNPGLTPDEISDKLILNADLNKVEREVENMQAGVKLTKRSFKGFDLSTSFYRGRDKTPTINKADLNKNVNSLLKEYSQYVKSEGASADNFDVWYDNNKDGTVLNLLYPKANRVGFDVIGDIGDIGVWTEAAYSIYEDDQFDNRLETAVGADYKFENNLYLVGQAYYQQGRLDSEDDIKAVNLHFDKPVFDFHEVKFNSLYEFETETYMVEPQFDYSLADSTVLQLGGTYIESDSSGSSGLISALGDDRVYARLKVEF